METCGSQGRRGQETCTPGAANADRRREHRRQPTTKPMERFCFHDDGSVFFVTFSVMQWLPVFVSQQTCKIVTDNLNFCHDKKGLRTNAYVIMPTHLHAIVFHESFQPHTLEQVLTDFRKFTGRQLCDFCEAHMPPCFSDTLREAAGNDQTWRFWQPTRHPEQIETESFWQSKIDYLHENPCRKGLVVRPDHWRFSSANWYLSDAADTNDVVLHALQW